MPLLQLIVLQVQLPLRKFLKLSWTGAHSRDEMVLLFMLPLLLLVWLALLQLTPMKRGNDWQQSCNRADDCCQSCSNSLNALH